MKQALQALPEANFRMADNSYLKPRNNYRKSHRNQRGESDQTDRQLDGPSAQKIEMPNAKRQKKSDQTTSAAEDAVEKPKTKDKPKKNVKLKTKRGPLTTTDDRVDEGKEPLKKQVEKAGLEATGAVQKNEELRKEVDQTNGENSEPEAFGRLRRDVLEKLAHDYLMKQRSPVLCDRTNNQKGNSIQIICIQMTCPGPSEFWHEQVAGALPVRNLPFSHPGNSPDLKFISPFSGIKTEPGFLDDYGTADERKNRLTKQMHNELKQREAVASQSKMFDYDTDRYKKIMDSEEDDQSDDDDGELDKDKYVSLASLKHSKYDRLADAITKGASSADLQFLRVVAKPTQYELSNRKQQNSDNHSNRSMSPAHHSQKSKGLHRPSTSPSYLPSKLNDQPKIGRKPPPSELSKTRTKGVLLDKVARSATVTFPLHRLVVPRVGDNILVTDEFKQSFLKQVLSKIKDVQSTVTVNDCRGIMAIVCHANPSLWTTDHRKDPSGAVSNKTDLIGQF